MVEHLPSMYEALGLNPQHCKTNKHITPPPIYQVTQLVGVDLDGHTETSA
jgi:hypothetical protein